MSLWVALELRVLTVGQGVDVRIEKSINAKGSFGSFYFNNRRIKINIARLDRVWNLKSDQSPERLD